MTEYNAARPRTVHPKLRVSCDRCGLAKLRCDRGQPRCGRCVSHGIPCVYGVSRKTGKPPRHKLRSSPTQTPPEQLGALETGNTGDGIGDQSAFATLDLVEWPAVSQFTTSPFQSMAQSCATNFATHAVLPTRLQTLDQVLSHHECWRKAYEMLGRLSMLDDLSLGTSLSVEEVPFDHMLCLSREAIDQLSKLQACSCAPCPSLAFLKASMVSKVLLWYHQATICMQAAASRVSTTIPTSVPPANIAVGTFSVDDERVQAALKIQLLLGEMRRTGLLIDRFTLRQDDSIISNNKSSLDRVDGLYQHLATWLKAEHSRIIHIMRSKLKEVNN